MVDLNFDEFFERSPHRGTRGHKHKLYKKSPDTRIRSEFFNERIITPLILAQLLVLKVVF